MVNRTSPTCQLPFSRSYGTILLVRFAASSLKRLGILYLTTCVGLGYDLMLPDA